MTSLKILPDWPEEKKQRTQKFSHDVLGTIPAVDELPDDLYEQMVRHHLNLSIQAWESHSFEQRGKMIATHRIINEIETVERAWDTIRKNAEKEAKLGKKSSYTQADD